MMLYRSQTAQPTDPGLYWATHLPPAENQKLYPVLVVCDPDSPELLAELGEYRYEPLGKFRWFGPVDECLESLRPLGAMEAISAAVKRALYRDLAPAVPVTLTASHVDAAPLTSIP